MTATWRRMPANRRPRAAPRQSRGNAPVTGPDRNEPAPPNRRHWFRSMPTCPQMPPRVLMRSPHRHRARPRVPRLGPRTKHRAPARHAADCRASPPTYPANLSALHSPVAPAPLRPDVYVTTEPDGRWRGDCFARVSLHIRKQLRLRQMFDVTAFRRIHVKQQLSVLVALQSEPSSVVVTPESGRPLYTLVRAVHPHTVVEFRMPLGLFAVHLASAVRDNGTGRVVAPDRRGRVGRPDHRLGRRCGADAHRPRAAGGLSPARRLEKPLSAGATTARVLEPRLTLTNSHSSVH